MCCETNKKSLENENISLFCCNFATNLKLPEDESMFCNSIILPDGQFRVGSDQFHAAHNLVSDA
jgi:hypothetical protein